MAAELKALAKPKSSKAVAAACGAAKPKVDRKFVPMNTKGLSQPKAKAFMPKAYHIHKDTTEHRWRVNGAPLAEGSKSKSYGTGSSETDWTAMVFVIMHCWRRHYFLTGEACPWEFGDAPEPS